MGQRIHPQEALVFDEGGLLANPSLWNEQVAQAIADADGVGQLSEAHWRVIHRLRNYFGTYGVPPAQVRLCSTEGMGEYCIHELFSTCFEAWRVAGLPDPGEEAKAYMSNM